MQMTENRSDSETDARFGLHLPLLIWQKGIYGEMEETGKMSIFHLLSETISQLQQWFN